MPDPRGIQDILPRFCQSVSDPRFQRTAPEASPVVIDAHPNSDPEQHPA